MLKDTKKYKFLDEEQLETLRWAAHKGQQRRRSIPTNGQVLGVLPREKSCELRYSWASHNGHSYLRIQDFQYDVRDNTWAPAKGKCLTVRVHELETVLGILQAAIELADKEANIEASDDLGPENVVPRFGNPTEDHDQACV